MPLSDSSRRTEQLASEAALALAGSPEPVLELKALPPQQQRLAVVQWAARLGAITAEALALRCGVSTNVASSMLGGAVKAGRLSKSKPLAHAPTLYTATQAGAKASQAHELAPCTVSTGSAAHLIACATAAAVLELRCGEHRLAGERELRRDERRIGKALASATLDFDEQGREVRHRPDLVLWPRASSGELDEDDERNGSYDSRRRQQRAWKRPIAVEIELTVKSAKRLEAICRAWSRCELVAGVLYIASPQAHEAVLSAVTNLDASKRIAVLALADPSSEAA
ncbi:MAG TPA: hypothetical protein VGF95_03650 [Solirubrobacteraceae bacterium]|jgi:hypothetical protein